MSELQNIQTNTAGKPDRINWPLRILLIVAAGLLLGWLSVGLPQSTPLVLLHTLLQLNMLQAKVGMTALLGPLALLMVQSLLILVAWGVFLWVIIREMITFFSVQTARQNTFAPTPPVSATPQSPYFAPGLPPLAQQAPVIPQRPVAPAPPHAQPVPSVASLSAQYAPTIYQQPPVPAIAPPAPVVASKPALPAPQARPQPIPSLYPPPPGYPPAQVAPSVSSLPTIQGAAPLAQSNLDNPFERNEPTPAPDQARPRPAKGVRQSDHSKTPNDPYAVQQDPYALQADSLQLFSEEDSSVPPAQQSEAPNFVFGNPFDGPLPDVFEHDEDLKRSLQQEQASSSRPSASPKEQKPPEQKK